MVEKCFSFGYSGLDVYPVCVEVDIHRGLPSISLVGLADAAVKESRDRIRAAIKNSSFEFPASRITVNLAPADSKKEGTHFDAAIALMIVAASGQLQGSFSEYAVVGELSLEGELRPVRGVFPMALKAKEAGLKLLLPLANAKEAALVEGLTIYAVGSLAESVAFLSGLIEKEPYVPAPGDHRVPPSYPVDFSEVKGQLLARRALEVGVSGMHNMLMIGPPGVGKTMLARRLPTILPDMELQEMLQVTKIYSLAGLIDDEQPLLKSRPYRSPHHTSSSVSLVGGGAIVKPGEVTLAHNGVLFLDELPEFKRDGLEALRQPLEDGFVHISRINRHVRLPSRFLLAAAMNPCPCGYFGSKAKNCRCSSYQIQKYRNKISGPLLDRIDIHIELGDVTSRELLERGPAAESSSAIKERVERARRIQRARLGGDGVFFNSQMGRKHLEVYCSLDDKTAHLLEMAMKHFSFSARAHDKVLKVARTIADLAAHERILPEDIAEAVGYRNLDKNLWA